MVSSTRSPFTAPLCGDGLVRPQTRTCSAPEVPFPGLLSSTCLYEKGNGASEFHARI